MYGEMVYVVLYGYFGPRDGLYGFSNGFVHPYSRRREQAKMDSQLSPANTIAPAFTLKVQEPTQGEYHHARGGSFVKGKEPRVFIETFHVIGRQVNLYVVVGA